MLRFAAIGAVFLIGCGLAAPAGRSEEHTSELQSHSDLVCRLLLEKKKQNSEFHSVFHRVLLLPSIFQKVLAHEPDQARPIRNLLAPAKAQPSRRTYSSDRRHDLWA